MHAGEHLLGRRQGLEITCCQCLKCGRPRIEFVATSLLLCGMHNCGDAQDLHAAYAKHCVKKAKNCSAEGHLTEYQHQRSTCFRVWSNVSDMCHASKSSNDLQRTDVMHLTNGIIGSSHSGPLGSSSMYRSKPAEFGTTVLDTGRGQTDICALEGKSAFSGSCAPDDIRA